MSTVKHSIIIPHHGSFEFLSHSIEKIYKTVHERDDCEIIIVNDDSSHRLDDQSLETMGFCGNAFVINNAKNLGYGGACNKGAEGSKGKFLTFIDSDLLPTDGWLERFENFLDTHKNIGQVGAKLLDFRTDLIQHYGASFWGVETIHPFQNMPSDFPPSCEDRQFQVIPSGLMMIGRELFCKVEGFEEKMYNAHVDFDLSMKVRDQEQECVVLGTPGGLHLGNSGGVLRQYLKNDAKSLFFKRWGKALKSDGRRFLREGVGGNPSLPPEGTKVVCVDLSSGLYRGEEFVTEYLSILGWQSLSYIAHSRFRLATGGRDIVLEETLNSAVMKYRTPLLIFADNIQQLNQNRHWCAQREHLQDIAADKNGAIQTLEGVTKMPRTTI